MAGYENKKKQIIKPDLRNLIKHITNFEEDGSEFKQCESFALSHVLHHSFLSVNRHQVRRSINGMVNKFSVHGFNEKAKRLEQLVEKFVTSERFKDHEEADVEWSILLLLITLSDNPTNVGLHVDINLVPEILPKGGETTFDEPEFNWKEYLNEGSESFQLSDNGDESTEWSDLESEEVNELYPPRPLNVSTQNFYDTPYLDISFLSEKRPTSRHSHQKGLHKDSERDRDCKIKMRDEKVIYENTLKQNVQYDWWNSASIRMEPTSNHPAARFAITREENEHKQTQGMIPIGSTLLISEYKLIREVLWVLRIPSDTFIFRLTDEGKIIIKENISIPSLSPASLCSYLKSNVTAYAEIVYTLTQFIDELDKAEYEMKKPPFTYQSYAKVLHELLLKIFREITSIEKTVEKQDTTITLVSVIEKLHPSLNKLHYIYCLHNTAVYDWKRSEGWFSSVRLLAVLYDDLCTNWKSEFCIIAMELFIRSFRVYLQIIDVWLSEGKLEDWRDEFIIKIYDGTLKVVSYKDVLSELKKSRLTKILDAVEKASSDVEYLRKVDEIFSLTASVKNKGGLYEECLKLLKNKLNKLAIDEKLLENKNIENVAGIKTGEENLNASESYMFHQTQSSQYSLGFPAADVDTLLYNLTTENLLNSPWLARAYNLCTEVVKSSCIRKTHLYSEIMGNDCIPNLGSLPLHHIIEASMLQLFTDRQRIASKIVVDTFCKKFKLQDHLAMLGNIFVLEASYIVQRFYTSLFAPDRPAYVERTEMSMNVLLDECVEIITSQYNLAINMQFSVTYEDNPALISDNIIDCITINYKVELPLALIITKESLEIYNEVFKFLLKIEWALATLHQLRFSDIKETPKNRLQVRTLYKLRMFLMHCVTTLHSYFVAFTPKKLRMDIEEKINIAANMEDLATAHNDYLTKLKSHCLLDKGNLMIKSVKKLMSVCGTLSKCWANEAESNLSSSELAALEDDYTKSHFSLHVLLKLSVGQHSNSSLILLSSEIERCLPVQEIEISDLL